MEAAAVAANDYLTSAVLTATAHVVAATGDLDGARRAAEQSVARVTGAGHLAAMAGVRLAMTRRELGEPAAATDALMAALPLIPPVWRVGYQAALTRLELEAGRLEPAIACAEAAETDAAALGLPLATAVAERARAAVLLAQGNADAAAALALRSADAADEAGAPLEAARSRVVAGAGRGDWTATAPSISSAARSASSTNAARSATAAKPAGSCAGSARGPSRADRPAPPTAASSRSPGASARWRR